MDPEELIGCEVIAVNKHHDYITILFDNGYEMDVNKPVLGTIEDILRETGD